MRSVFLFLAISQALLIQGCAWHGTVNISDFDGRRGIATLDGSGLFGAEDAAAWDAHKVCNKMSNGYGIKTINKVADNRYVFTCVIKTPQEASAPQSTQSSVVSEQSDRNSFNSKEQCADFGFKYGTKDFSNCVLKLEIAKQQNNAAQKKYAAEKAAYEQQMAAHEKERERQRGMKSLELGLRMMGGQSPVDAVNSVGTGAPIAPRAPSPTMQTITLPNGRMVNCTTMGTMTNCF